MAKYGNYLAFLRALFFIVFVMSCNQHKDGFNINYLTKEYSEHRSDSLKLQCLAFLNENMTDLTSEKVVFYNRETGEEKDIRLDTITMEESLKKILDKYRLSYKEDKVPDSIILTNKLIESTIDKALYDWNRYPWNKGIPKDIFLNYLLPYKILGEYPEAWRSKLYNIYSDSIREMVIHYRPNSNVKGGIKTPDDVYYKIIVNGIERTVHYTSEFTQLTDAPSFDELIATKSGECDRLSRLYTYLLRSTGFPCTIDVVPLWGSKNGSHESEVFWNSSTSKMSVARGRTFDRPAKVFRMSFKRQNIWSDSILPNIGGNFFLLTNLENNHWLDVTEEHTRTASISHRISGAIYKGKFAYICVFNYGSWQPLFWGKVDNRGYSIFKKMGCDVIYQIAVPSGQSCKLIGRAFLLDTCGKIAYKTPDFSRRIEMKLAKINSGTKAYVKKDKLYALYMLEKSNEWKLCGKKMCSKDSVINFHHIPAGAFYKLIDVNLTTRLERIFLYRDQVQVWY